jgi:hypothetical protein
MSDIPKSDAELDQEFKDLSHEFIKEFKDSAPKVLTSDDVFEIERQVEARVSAAYNEALENERSIMRSRYHAVVLESKVYRRLVHAFYVRGVDTSDIQLAHLVLDSENPDYMKSLDDKVDIAFQAMMKQVVIGYDFQQLIQSIKANPRLKDQWEEMMMMLALEAEKNV